jgi:hypothetical protein
LPGDVLTVAQINDENTTTHLMLHACPNHESKSIHQFAADSEREWQDK